MKKVPRIKMAESSAVLGLATSPLDREIKIDR